ncbi:MAG: hypothetical protein GY804_03860 [Alphaproteobacteria bacterium]|nr:hypothetical protein [Alphaproteobacteria bacterium]
MNNYKIFSNCVGWDSSDVHKEGGLCDLIDQAIDITRKTFLKHVDKDELKEIERNFGYDSHHSQGLTMAQDWHVSYHRSKHHQETVYFFKHSGIEYVFKKGY